MQDVKSGEIRTHSTQVKLSDLLIPKPDEGSLKIAGSRELFHVKVQKTSPLKHSVSKLFMNILQNLRRKAGKAGDKTHLLNLQIKCIQAEESRHLYMI